MLRFLLPAREAYYRASRRNVAAMTSFKGSGEIAKQKKPLLVNDSYTYC